MTKIIIVDYSLDIVIAIINNDYFEQIYALFEAAWRFYIKYILKKAENTLPELLLLFYSIEPQMSTIHWFGFFFKQKKVQLCIA